ncbi:MAG: zf-HC2 domain-containing protein [Oscillospiraceae bacterium]|nr:zf-HC2 domain-containing protein [Oscillospiraceae bacterium]
MRMDCDVIKDLLPLYAEDMVSDKSRELIRTHFDECEECRKLYETMMEPAPKAEFTKEPAKSFQKYVKKSKRKLVLRVALITAAVVAAVFIARLIAIGGLMAFLMLDSALAPIKVDTDVNHYSQYMGENAKSEYRNKWGLDESIFPLEITADMDVKEYKMVYYNPWDAQYLSYLTVEYDEAAYAAELERLGSYTSTDYIGYYSVTGFSEDAPLLAMYADDYHGFIYAIDTPDAENTVTYVELIFCNYFMDLAYEEYMPSAYFPEGFDATMDNPYEKKMMAQH